jgi:hypothetical protein
MLLIVWIVLQYNRASLARGVATTFLSRAELGLGGRGLAAHFSHNN